MQKKYLNILSVLILLLTFGACNSEKRVYESEKTSTKKTRKHTFAIGKFNKLVRSGDSEAKYAAAIKYFDKKDFVKAQTLFEELMNVYRGTSKAEEVHYYFANCNYFLQDYIIAGYQFRNFVKNFPSSKHAEYCSYMNAYCFYLNSPEYSLEQVDTYLAIKEFERFTVKYPKSDKIKECNELLDKLRAKLERKSYESALLYYNTGAYKSAVVAFENHIKDFSDTKHVEELHYLTIKSYYLLALNSIESKKQERFKSAADSYIKFIDKYPESKFIKDAETIYTNSLQNLEKYNKPTS